jgi:hypothetical protein
LKYMEISKKLQEAEELLQKRILLIVTKVGKQPKAHYFPEKFLFNHKDKIRTSHKIIE